ncbi:hypothetical protein K469DRAFT_726852 [Zopfia rhizophila CBS 207.26]|uniref:Uncharacterized protein n=1 Tax=Zopfia rhizophila CBS 207.26 TaxID=1314779 RepID=A0A6A6E084_9PEZI|nr:hypothetical protein K469DRAFT_726852 [Zopfia rhizophila CBS 207.26]
MAAEAPTVTSASKTGTNDDNRLDIQHKVMYDTTLQLVHAPTDLSKGGYKLLDQATGSGEHAYIPHLFLFTDLLADLLRTGENSFDLVHSRMALPGVGTNPLSEAVKNLIALNNGPEGTIFHNAIKDLFAIVSGGQGVDLREKLIPMFKEAGLENIGYKILTTPFCARASEKIRKTSEASLFATAMGVSMTTKMLDVMPQKVIEEANKDGWEFKAFALWAQKPLSK